MQHNVKFFVINLDRSPERLAECQNKFSSIGISLERISAVDGKANDLSSFFDDEACRKEMGRSIQPGEVGCFLSHVNAIQKFWEGDAEYAVILEDDALPSDDFLQTLEELIRGFRRDTFETYAVNLGASDFKYSSNYRTLGSGMLRCAHRFPMLATGILWSRSGAKLFLDDHKTITQPYDNYLRFLLSGTNKAFSVRPSMVMASGAASDIEARNVSRRRSSQNRSHFYFFFKQRRIIREKVRALVGKVRWLIR
jgi:glycosyl transferase family 25